MSERIFVDTSAILALLVPTDRAHQRASRAFNRLRAASAPLVASSYVLVETYALLQSRIGPEAVRAFRDEFAPLLDVVWIDGETHEAALDELLNRSGPVPSLVDMTSFRLMRTTGIDRVFAFDQDFELEGFEAVG